MLHALRTVLVKNVDNLRLRCVVSCLLEYETGTSERASIWILDANQIQAPLYFFRAETRKNDPVEKDRLKRTQIKRSKDQDQHGPFGTGIMLF